MITIFKRKRLETEDWLRYHPLVRRAIGRLKLLRTPTDAPDDPQAIARTINALAAAARLTDGELEARIQARIAEQVQRLDTSALDWTEFVPRFRDGKIVKGAILKPFVSPNERGVIYISFEDQWAKLLSLANLTEFAQRYTLVIGPSSSPHNLVNYVFPAAYPEPFLTLISNPHDCEVLPRVSERMTIVPLYASSWVNPDLYAPLPRNDRIYDLIMVASWGKVKRHQALFAAMRSMPPEMRVLLVGQDQEGRTAETIGALADWYGVRDRVTILSDQPYAAVAKLFCQAKASVVLSKREGSCVVVTESMFANTPVAVLRGAELGSRVFVNDETGRLLGEPTLARDLTEFVQNADRYQPRAWAERHISCYRSSQILNDALKQHALAHGLAWTQDIVPMQRTPNPSPARAEDRTRMAGERDDILRRFALEIGPGSLQ
jgi:hypothetical protein